MGRKVLVVGGSCDLVQLLRRGLPVLLRHHLNQLLVQVVAADLGLAESHHAYSLLAPSLNISNIFNIIAEHQLTECYSNTPRSLALLLPQGRKSRWFVRQLARAAVVPHVWILVHSVLLGLDLPHAHHSLCGFDHLLEQVDLLLQLLAFEAEGLAGLSLALPAEGGSLELVHFCLDR